MRGDSSTRSLFSRWAAKVAIGDDCWEWMGSRRPAGYGRLRDERGTPYRAHRISYRLLVGDIPDGFCVCHHCDNPGCVKPSHLFVDTQEENIRDRESKGRGAAPPVLRGEDRPDAKLTEQDVREIRRRLSFGESQRSLAIRFGVSRTAVSAISSGRNWAWLD